ncbi:uncharacterized protein LOC126999449 [Eriocheir sinensis]|uniref:uncharacterized protein LOC126999449 n=1 Tax=Eriocheir sinensis TaxID=95602 RepID=UPI0021C8A0A8|nr:uncharacterized protein LOC126999449 [Eriocheir sinensis]
MASRRREKRKLCLVAEPSSGSDADTKNNNTSKKLRDSHDAAAEPSSDTTKTSNRKRLRGSHDAAAELSSDTTKTSNRKRLRDSHDAAAEPSSDTSNTSSSKRRRVSHHAAAEPSSDTTKTSNRKRLRDSHDAAAEPTSDTTNTSSSKRLRGLHDAAAEPSSDTTNTNTSSKKSEVAAPDGSSGRGPSPGGQEEGKAPDASSGPAKKRKASSSGPTKKLRCCRRCLQLTRGERRAWRSLRAAGVPLLTRCEVLAMHSGDGAIIGMGGFGMCVKGRDPRTGHEVVLKSFHREGLGALEHEAASLWALRRVPGLQRLVGACVQTNQLVSLFAGESLYKYFGAKPRRPAAAALGVFQQAARTLQAMGEAGYAHNDVNPGNACARDQEGRGGPEVTVIDVGMASPVGSGGHFRQVSDPYWLPWVAPELLLHTGPCGESSDAYGLAFLMDEVLERVTHSPSLGPVLAWVDRASSRDPHARPGLAELQEVLQKALAEEGMH